MLEREVVGAVGVDVETHGAGDPGQITGAAAGNDDAVVMLRPVTSPAYSLTMCMIPSGNAVEISGR